MCFDDFLQMKTSCEACRSTHSWTYQTLQQKNRVFSQPECAWKLSSIVTKLISDEFIDFWIYFKKMRELSRDVAEPYTLH